MKQYQKVYVPDFNGGIAVYDHHRGRKIHLSDVSIALDVIVLTPSQLREVYFDGFNQAHYAHVHPETFPAKEIETAAADYFKAKNIEIP